MFVFKGAGCPWGSACTIQVRHVMQVYFKQPFVRSPVISAKGSNKGAMKGSTIRATVDTFTSASIGDDGIDCGTIHLGDIAGTLEDERLRDVCRKALTGAATRVASSLCMPCAILPFCNRTLCCAWHISYGILVMAG